jgi:hypothetical protein
MMVGIGGQVQNRSLSKLVARGASRLVIAAVLWAAPVAAQERAVADTADRPGFADGSVLLGRGHVHVKFGITTDSDDWFVSAGFVRRLR